LEEEYMAGLEEEEAGVEGRAGLGRTPAVDLEAVSQSRGRTGREL